VYFSCANLAEYNIVKGRVKAEGDGYTMQKSLHRIYLWSDLCYAGLLNTLSHMSTVLAGENQWQSFLKPSSPKDTSHATRLVKHILACPQVMTCYMTSETVPLWFAKYCCRNTERL
jgi:hypothetical protein